MKPRDFLNFFKTKSGKLVLFAVVFGGGLVLFSVMRDRSRGQDDMDVRVCARSTNATDNPQVVQTIVRPMQTVSSTADPKPEPQHASLDQRAASRCHRRNPAEPQPPQLATHQPVR